MDISLVTYDGLPDLDPDDRLLTDELIKREHKVSACIWDDDSIDWSKFDIAIVRSAWNYHLKLDQFHSWMDRIAPQTALFNSPKMMKWNSHKTYLRELAAANLPVVETLWVEKGGQGTAVFDELDWQTVIVKPAVGLATFGVKKFTLDADGRKQAAKHTNALAETDAVMIQPFLAAVDDHGERALTFLGGEFSHTVRKSSFQALAPAGLAGESSVASDPEEVAVAKQVIDYLWETPLYARVDLVRDPDGKPVVLELELVEPSLFLSFHPPAATRFADVLERNSKS